MLDNLVGAVANIAPKFARRLDTGVVKDIAMQVLGSDSAPNMIARGIGLISKEGILYRLLRTIFSLFGKVVSDAKAATRRDVLTCLKWTTILCPVYLGGIATMASRTAIVAGDFHVIKLHPIDPLVCAD